MCVIIVKRVIFILKCTEMCLATGLRLDPLGKLTALPGPPDWIKANEKGWSGREVEGERKSKNRREGK